MMKYDWLKNGGRGLMRWKDDWYNSLYFLSMYYVIVYIKSIKV